jgi:hypothetical protein
MSVWGRSFGAAFGVSFGATSTRKPWVARGSYDPGDESADKELIDQQNHMLITMVTALVASGALV